MSGSTPAFAEGQTVTIASTAQSGFVGAIGTVVERPKWIGSWSYRIKLTGALVRVTPMRFWENELEMSAR